MNRTPSHLLASSPYLPYRNKIVIHLRSRTRLRLTYFLGWCAVLVVLSKAVQPLLTQPSTPRYNYQIMIFSIWLNTTTGCGNPPDCGYPNKRFFNNVAIPRNQCCYNLFLIILNFVHVPTTLRLLLYFFLALITFITIYSFLNGIFPTILNHTDFSLIKHFWLTDIIHGLELNSLACTQKNNSSYLNHFSVKYHQQHFRNQLVSE